MCEPFGRPNPWPTLGVEIELQLVDDRSFGLRSAIGAVLADVPEPIRDVVKPEFMQCYVEINSQVCQTVGEAAADLERTIRIVERIADRHGLRLFWAGTHPFSHWRDQEITPNARYYRLAAALQETVVRPVTFGLHVHVGMPSGERAIAVGDRLQEYLPLLLALSANSPFWHGRWTGHHAHRIEILESFPTGGLPPRLGSWAEYARLVDRLTVAGFVADESELWWDVRPSARTGTVEVRICDMPACLADLRALTALIQCLAATLSHEVAQGVPAREIHPLIVRQNRWRACRYGLDAELVDPVTLRPQPARRMAEELARGLSGCAERLGCAPELESVAALAAGRNGAQRQLAVFQQTGDLAEVVRRLSEASRVGPSDQPAGPASTRPDGQALVLSPPAADRGFPGPPPEILPGGPALRR
jgi:carboxylate-amine ligase